MKVFKNPFRPGAGQPPPFLAGREDEQDEFRELLKQTPVLKNLIITGLRGVGKTVLLETLKPIAIEKSWFWAGTDLSESASVSEETLAIRIMADLSVFVSSFPIGEQEIKSIGYLSSIEKKEIKLTYDILLHLFNSTPGLVSDKLKTVLEFVWNTVKNKAKGIVLAYDEAQNLQDKAVDKQYPLSVLLEVIQYLQRKEIPYFLILTGLPTLFPNLVETRTYAERMFHIMTLDKLKPGECKEAIIKPIAKDACPVNFTEETINVLIKYSGGYPYFIQFFCKEIFDLYIQQLAVGIKEPVITIQEIIKKLDNNFYYGRWSRITDRQRDVLNIIAELPSANEEFTTQDIILKAKEIGDSSLSSSYINQMLKKLIDSGLIYKNKHGRYSFAVPLLADYIKRQKSN